MTHSLLCVCVSQIKQEINFKVNHLAFLAIQAQIPSTHFTSQDKQS